jgi:hypothetical protein
MMPYKNRDIYIYTSDEIERERERETDRQTEEKYHNEQQLSK